MAESKQEKEFKDFGITGKLRTGLVTGMMGIMLLAIGWLAKVVLNIQEDRLKMQDRLYKEMIEEVKSQVSPAVEKVNQAATKVDSAAVKVDSVAQQQKERNGGKR
ncbi:hypothetical protein MUK51_10890 [Sphingobacterium faecium]|uniref:hypothetical protein n=1 Tax=Sphingobacterium faecium TaxID=34087 RepID=UPI0021B5FB14|nr:hypothetical protein [Sphingobacterium faecium]UXD67737.1 hypothetical protein MUK51_10890 [Sphingobacterium faecium]